MYICIYSVLAYREDAVAAASPSPSLDPAYEVTDSTDTCEKKDEYNIHYDRQLHTDTIADNNATSDNHTAPDNSNSNSNSSSTYIIPVSMPEPETDSSEWGLGPDRSGVQH